MRFYRISVCSYFSKNNVLYSMVIIMERDFDNLVYGNFLKELRKQNKLTQEELEKLIDNVSKMSRRDKEVIFSLAEILAKKKL